MTKYRSREIVEAVQWFPGVKIEGVYELPGVSMAVVADDPGITLTSGKFSAVHPGQFVSRKIFPVPGYWSVTHKDELDRGFEDVGG